MVGGAWWAAAHGVAKSRTRLSDFTYLLTRCVLKETLKEFFLREGRLHRSETQMFIKKGRTLEKELVMVKKKENLLLTYGQ